MQYLAEQFSSQNEMTNRTDTSCAPDPADIEMSSISSGVLAASTPSIQDEVLRASNGGNVTHSAGPARDQVQTIWDPYRNRFRVLASCLTVFGNGSNDSAPGALIASIEK
jgi:hypothetical protein